IALADLFLTLEQKSQPLTGSFIILNLGHTQTNMSIVGGGLLRFAKSVSFGAETVIDSIMKSMEIPFASAEEIMKEPKLWEQWGLNIKNILRKSTPNLIEALYRSIEYCRSTQKVLEIEKILLTGGLSALQGFDEFIAEIIGLKTERWNPFLSLKGNYRQDLVPYMSVALALALRQSPKRRT
ncbi:MAG TPA: pilus assembly protein PilM, partial [bacterium]|nr:pilus assembly protein PilM [bacterium]